MNLLKCFLPVVLLLLPQVAKPQASLKGDGALLRALDTITGRVEDLEIEFGKSKIFKNFRITLEDRRYLSENPVKYSFAYVTITDHEDESVLFSAWMISQSPALSAVEHPRFDFWLIRCTTLSPDASNGIEEN